MSGAPTGFPNPIFIGGFGRSGTHAIGHLVGADPRYHLVDTELRLHSVNGGLPHLLDGTTDMDSFVEACWKVWWRRGFRQPQGIHRMLSEKQFQTVLESFQRDFDDDPWAASRKLVDEIVAPNLEKSGRPGWLELTGRSAIFAPTLLRLYPEARFINIVRDGRAIAGGHVKKIDMTDEPLDALYGWARMIRESHEGLSAIPQEHVLIIKLDDLASHDREGTFDRVCDFLETTDREPMRKFFDRKISAGRAHVGKWRLRMPPSEARKVDRAYRKLIRDMHAEGVWWAPEPEPRLESLRAQAEQFAERLPIGSKS